MCNLRRVLATAITPRPPFIGECRAFAGVLPSGLVGDWENTRFPAQ
jgi:hypothetical protein